MADDKRPLMADWEAASMPGKQYLKIMHSLNTKGPAGLSEKEAEVLERWMLYSRNSEYLNPALKYCLESIVNEKDAKKKKELLLEFNGRFLHYTFTDERDKRGLGSPSPAITENPSNRPKGKDKVDVTQSQFSIPQEDLKNMSTDEIIRLIKEDKTAYNFSLETADVSFLKKIDWEYVVQPSRIGIALSRLPNFGFNKVEHSNQEHLCHVEMVQKVDEERQPLQVLLPAPRLIPKTDFGADGRLDLGQRCQRGPHVPEFALHQKTPCRIASPRPSSW